MSEIAKIQEALSIESSAPEISKPDEVSNKTVKRLSELSNGNCVSEMSMTNEFTNETQLDQNELSTMSMSKGCTDDLAQKQCEHLQNSGEMSTKDSVSIITGDNMESQGESAIRDSLSTENNIDEVLQYNECTRELAQTQPISSIAENIEISKASVFTNKNVQIRDELSVKNSVSEITEVQKALSVESASPEMSGPDEGGYKTRQKSERTFIRKPCF